LLEEADARVVVEMLDLATRLDDTVAAAEADQTVRGAPVHDQPDEPPADDESHLAALLADVDVVVRVLGEVEAVRLSPAGEQRLASERQKGLEALAYMALRESAVDREDLEITLFPTGANATKTFHNTVSAARRTVGEELLPHSTSGRYELSARVVTDYGLFCDLVARAEETDDAERAAAMLGEALGLVRGEPFTGVGRGYSWVSSHRGTIVAQVVDAAEELAEVSLATGDWRTAEWAARQGLAAFPCDERMYRLLMRTAKAAGNTPGVKRAFRELCDAVADPDDGVEPIDTVHSETVALLEELTGSERQRMDA
jgi:DNA-binding SARP family transcriptional activator